MTSGRALSSFAIETLSRRTARSTNGKIENDRGLEEEFGVLAQVVFETLVEAGDGVGGGGLGG